MKRCARVVALAVAAVLAGVPVGAGPDPQAEKAAIARVVRASLGWFETKDFELLARSVADDPDYFVFQPYSKGTVRGIAQARERWAIFRDPASRFTSLDIRELRIHLHASGEVAWYSAIVDDCGEFGGQLGCWKDTRWTGVLEKRGESWVIMQMHFSFAADAVRAEAEKACREKLQAPPPSP